MSLQESLSHIGTIFLLINTILFFKSFTIEGKAFKFFSIYLFGILVIQVIMTYYAVVLDTPNIFISHFYLIVQFVFLSFFYEKLLKNKIPLLLGGLVLLLLVVQYIIEPYDFNQYNALGISVTQIIVIIYSITYFFLSIQKREPPFLFANIGIFLYLICSTLIFASGNLVFNVSISRETYVLLFHLNAILYIIFQILIFIEWRKNYYKKIHRS